MRIKVTLICLLVVISTIFAPFSTQSQVVMKTKFTTNGKSDLPISTLWREPSDIRSRDLFYGIGGRQHLPGNTFTFIKEDKGGTNPKFEVKDENGVTWKVKLGLEAQSETAATRLVWAVGYFTDEDYYLPEIQVSGLKKLSRSSSLVGANGNVSKARLERVFDDTESTPWNWFNNPFARSREMNGLRVMMALINNWDLKADNNRLVMRGGAEPRFIVSDLGATFGRTGDHLVRSRNNVVDFITSKFIKKVDPEEVDFVLNSRPHPFLFFNLPYYIERTRMERIAKDIPRTDAKWIGGLLNDLSNQQLNDAFRAAGYSASDVGALAGKVRSRIIELNGL